MVIPLIHKIQAEVRIEKAEKPSHGIVDIANKENARFIVTGSRGMGVIRRTILGSVSDFILHHANCPVFVYKMQWNAQLTPTIHEKLYYIKKYYSRDVVKKWLRWYIHVILCSMVSIGTLSVFLIICDAFKKTQECLQLVKISDYFAMLKREIIHFYYLNSMYKNWVIPPLQILLCLKILFAWETKHYFLDSK